MGKAVRKFVFVTIIVSVLIGFLISHKALVQATTQNLNTSISKDVIVSLDGQLLNFDVPPMIIDDRTLVPFRVILEALGTEVEWKGDTRTVTAIKDDLNIKLRIDSKEAFINNKKTTLDVPARIIDGRTLIPARFISEALGCKVDWNGNTRTVIISSSTDDTKNTHKELVFQNIAIGDSTEKVINAFGQPARRDLSKYGFRWYIYNKDYKKYIQIGIMDNRVVGLYTNADNWKSKKGIEIGTSKNEVRNIYGKPLSEIVKGNTIYKLDNSEADTYLIEGYYTTIFYDLHKDDVVTAVLLIEKETEEALNSYYGKASDELKKSYERQTFDLANAVRARFNKNYYQWDEAISKIARKHSEDMAKHSYFSHTNLEGKTPFERMEESNIGYTMAAENIAAGQQSAIFAHEGWMNSEGHRKNILGDCERLGIGISFGGDYQVYYTQNFYTPRKLFNK